MRSLLAASVLGLVALAPSRASASPWRLTLSAGTDFPIALSARADVEGPYRLRASTSLGVMPGAYVDAINALATSAGWYTQSEADLIRIALQTSLVWRTHVGWRPFARHGFNVMAGYGLVALGGGASAQQLIAGITGQMPPGNNATAASATYAVSSTLHMIDVELGWEWRLLGEHLVVQAALGFAGTLASHTTITPQYTPRYPQATATFANYGAAYLDDTLQSYVFTPTLSVFAGYRF